MDSLIFEARRGRPMRSRAGSRSWSRRNRVGWPARSFHSTAARPAISP